MYSIKAKSISSIIPSNILDKYPLFVEFLEKYYEWQTKTTIDVGDILGNMDIANRFYGITSEFSVNKDVVNRDKESYTVEFDAHRTFLDGERLVGYRGIDEPIEVTLGPNNEYRFDGIEGPKVTLYKGQTYKFLNSTGKPMYVKTRRVPGSGELFPDITNNGTVGLTLEVTVTENTPQLLYYTIGQIQSIGVLSIQSIPATFQNTTNTFDPTETTITGFAILESILFNPEYILQNFDSIGTIDAPDAFFYRFLGNYGLEELFSNNYQLRRSVNDFLRFFQKKGTEDAIKFFFRNFFDRDVSISYPGELVLKPSDSEYFIRDQLFVDATDGIELTRNRRILGERSGTTSIIEAIVFDAAENYYKIYLDKDKTSGQFRIGEPILVIDNDDDSIRYDVNGRVLGTVSKFEIVEKGSEYTIGETITNNYTLGGEIKSIPITISDISSAIVRRYSIGTAGTGYAVGDAVYFPRPEKKTEFYAVVTESTVSHNFTVNFEDFSLYTLNFDGAKVSIAGVEYTVNGYDSGTNTLQLKTDLFAPTVRSGNILNIFFPVDNVTDPYYDPNYFHPNSSVIKDQAIAYVSEIGGSGEIEELRFINNGSGYIKKPTTTDSKIWIVSTSGTGANLEIIGQDFGGVKRITADIDIVGLTFTTIITLKRGTDPADNDARIRLVVDSTSKYGNFFADNKGFLSDKIYLHDSYYYQDFSYVIQSDLNFSDFANLFRQLAHPAGMIFFNQFFIINFFRQKINSGSDVANAIKTIHIEKIPDIIYSDFSIELIANVTTFTKFLFTVFEEKLYNEFLWRSESVASLDNTYETASGVTISTWSGVTLEHPGFVARTLDENWIDHTRTVELVSDINGTGTLTYESTESGQYSDFLTISGGATTFTTEIGTGDLINVLSDQLLVNYINSDTELVAQRLSTVSGIVVTAEPFTVTQRLNTELGYSTFSNLKELNSTTDSETSDYPTRYSEDIFVNN